MLVVGWNKLRAVPAVESQNAFKLPELRGACSSLLLRHLKNHSLFGLGLVSLHLQLALTN